MFSKEGLSITCLCLARTRRKVAKPYKEALIAFKFFLFFFFFSFSEGYILVYPAVPCSRKEYLIMSSVINGSETQSVGMPLKIFCLWLLLRLSSSGNTFIV